MLNVCVAVVSVTSLQINTTMMFVLEVSISAVTEYFAKEVVTLKLAGVEPSYVRLLARVGAVPSLFQALTISLVTASAVEFHAIMAAFMLSNLLVSES